MNRALPAVGLGTMGIDAPEVVTTALELGYRHLDTAQIYENEAVVGDGLAAADVARDDVFLATKVWADNLAPEDVRESTRASLDRLGVEYVDLLYVHRPIESYDPAATLAAFDDLRADGLVEHVGVSNFTTEQLAVARAELDAPLFANQVETHPLWLEDDLLAAARDGGYHLVGYSPFAQGEAFDCPEVRAVAERHDASAAQVCLAWLAAKGVTPIPKASSETHLRANLAAADLELDDEDVAKIDAIDREEKLFE